MNAKQFIEMQKQDIQTHKNKVILNAVVTAMEEVLKKAPDVDIDHQKTAEDCYAKMYEYAKKNKSENMYVFTPEGTSNFIAEYLGVKNISAAKTDEPVKEEKKRRNLEDFF